MGLHTRYARGKQVIVTLLDGTVIEDRMGEVKSHNRWVELQQHGRVMRADIKSMSLKKGVLNLKRLKGKKR